LGFDEWAWRKRRRYGTILVDLETHQVIDLLPDDQRATITAWLQAHPGVEVISRDRSGPFALAATEGAPRAQQVADRFHLLQNLAQTLQRVFERHSGQLEAVRTRAPDSGNPAMPTASGAAPARPAPENTPPALAQSSVPAPSGPATRVQRQAQYSEAHRLYRLGWRKQAIAAHLGVVPETVRRWLRSATYQARPGNKGRGRPLGSKVDRYEPYLRQRWAEGCQNGRILYEELVAQGYSGSYSLLRKWLVDRRVREPGAPLTPPRPRRHSIPDLVLACYGGRRRARQRRSSWLLNCVAWPGRSGTAAS
jgi:transposase